MREMHQAKNHYFNGQPMLAYGAKNSWNIEVLMARTLPEDEPMCQPPLPIANQFLVDQLKQNGCPSAEQYDGFITAAQTFQSGSRNSMVGVFGPPSSGKTSTVFKIGEMMGMDTRLVNVLNIKNDNDIGPHKEPSLHQWISSNSGRSKLILVDEFEKSNKNAIARIFQVIEIIPHNNI